MANSHETKVLMNGLWYTPSSLLRKWNRITPGTKVEVPAGIKREKKNKNLLNLFRKF